MQSAGFAILLLLSLFKDFFGSLNGFVFHSSLATPTLLAAILLDFLFVTAAVYFLITWLHARADWDRSRIALLILCPAVLIIFNRLLADAVWVRLYVFVHDLRHTEHLPPPLAMPFPFALIFIGALLWAVILITCWKFAPRIFAGIVDIARLAALSAGVFSLALLFNLLMAGARRAHDNRVAAIQPHSDAAQASRPRVVWIVLDELSYKQAFERRVPDLNLPNLDHLRGESALYTNARPIASNTDLALPAMLLGRQLSRMSYRLPNRLSFVYAADQQWHRWDPGQTILADAERAQWNVALAGWWNPYCTMFSGVLQHCLWTANSPYNPMRPWYGVARNMALAFVAPFRQQSTAPLLQVHKEENLKLLERGKQDLADPRMDFVMVHLGTPHYPYVFDRHTGQFTTEQGHSYQDGLAMADWALGQLLQQIESDPRWANTTLVVNGDHSWRPVIWTAEPGWTEEDQRTSDGAKFDDRPALLIHRAGQTTPATVAEPTSLLEIHTVLESAIHSAPNNSAQ